MKKKYLAAYDYGTGAVWAVITATSKEAIIAKYPVLEVFDEPPSWMSSMQYDRIFSTSSFDLDDEPPDWLKADEPPPGWRP
jgi:hypothetical protein